MKNYSFAKIILFFRTANNYQKSLNDFFHIKINLSEMSAKLLQKIEELTLYVIQQNEKIESLENKVKDLENK